MTQIANEMQYEKACEIIERLLKVVDNETSIDDINYVELELISNLVVDYEEKYYPILPPSDVEI